MRHIEIPRIEAFLIGLGRPGAEEALQPPVLGHLLGCRMCGRNVKSLSVAHLFHRLDLHPGTECPKDDELKAYAADCGSGSAPALSDHLRCCLWCALAVHDYFSAFPLVPATASVSREKARSESRRVMRLAALRSSAPKPPSSLLWQKGQRHGYYLGRQGNFWANPFF